MRFRSIMLAIALAALITLVVRLTVFSDDCNLMVVGMTFILSFAVCYLALRLLDFFISKNN